MIDYGEFIRARITHSQSADTSEGYPCELPDSLGRQLLDYKIYGNSTQNGVPCISNPIDVVSVGDLVTDETDENYGKYKIPIVAYGKNFLDCTYAADNYSYGTIVNKDFSITVNVGSNATSSPINIRQSKPYTIPADNTVITASCKNACNEVKMVLNVQKANSTELDCYTITSNNHSLTLSKGDTIQAYLQIPANGIINEAITLYPQLEAGDTATAFEPYIKPVVTSVYLDEPLRKVGNYQDYIDFKNQKVVRRIKKHNISTKATWIDWQTGNGSRLVFYISAKLYGNNLTTLGYFNYDEVFQNLYNRPTDGKGLYAYIDGSNTYWYPDYTVMGLDGSEDLATANAALQNWLQSAGDIYFTYVLKNPVETKVSLPVIPTRKGNTFVATNSTLPPSNIYVKYAVKS